ncbi:MAG: hypothetical protein MSG64_06735 [Pyrinomonadaceae bacterium MAG19_C2-C3]|nr:hypothetical protein [Pyrinomonadaceae bacterium MAG19_C2-C3]
MTEVSEAIWETFDGLFKTLYRQGERVEQLERRVIDLEGRLQERAATGISTHNGGGTLSRFEAIEDNFPAERAA